MRSFNKPTTILFFLFLGLGWQCGGEDGKDNNGQDSSVSSESPDRFSDQSSNSPSVDTPQATSETENGDEANFADLKPPMYDLNGKWFYTSDSRSFQGCWTTLVQKGNLIEFPVNNCPSGSWAKGTINGDKVEFVDDQQWVHFTGQILSVAHMEGEATNGYTTGKWYMDKEGSF